MRILIAGSGGVGGYFGSLLAKANKDVTFLAREDHLKAIQKKGLMIKSILGDFAVKVKAYETLPKMVKPFDLILVCVKAHHTKALLTPLRKGVGENTLIISLQNGLDRQKPLLEAFGKEKVAAGLTVLGAYVEEPGIIRHLACGEIVVGELDGQESDRLKKMVDEFKQAKINIELTQEILHRQWQKMIWNVGFNGPTALLDVSVGEILKREEQCRLIYSLMKEAVEVGKAMGEKFSDDFPQETIDYSKKELSHIVTSMVYDRRRNRPLEWQIFNGFISKAGDQFNIPTPANDLIKTLLEGLSSHG